ncbi:phage tail protein [Hafnia alvei]|uniref:phage tail protein n=1 Tax=Hafnia alvei TaxID=569 RepID=UPI0004701366|nr:phage tail protein [Hafnia alvei]
MAQKYKAVLTKIGAAKIAAATAGGTKINLTQMAVGDGGGTLPTPDPAQTKLIAEKHRAALNKVSVDAKHKNYLVAELVIPPEIGGFWMRELGLFDEVGDLIAVSNMAESYKPLLSEGSGRAQTLRMVVIVSDMDTVNLLIDSSTVLATQEYVDDKLLEHEQSRIHPDATLKEKGFTQLSSATNSNSEALAATPKAVKAAYDKATEADKNAKTADENADKANDNANTRLEKDKNLSDLKDKPQARRNLELGTAAIANVQKSITDNTPNALMINGAWGLGASGVGMVDSDILSPTSIGNAFFNQGGGAANSHFGGYGTGIHLSYGSNGDNKQRLTANLFVDSAGNLSVEWLAVNKNDGAIVVKHIQKLYGPLNKPTPNDVDAWPIAIRGNIGNGTLLSTANQVGVYLISISKPETVSDFPKIGNTPLYGYGFMFVTKNGASINQLYMSHHGHIANRQSWNNETGYVNGWNIGYGTINKPTASDVGALPIGGGTLNGNLTVRNQIQVGSVGNGFLTIGDNDSGLRSSVDGQVDLWANGVFRGYWNTTTFSFTGQIIPSNYNNFDTRYQAKGNYTPAGEAYTKAVSDARFQLKGNYTPAGEAYTKGESDGRYMRDVRLGTQARTGDGSFTIPAGCVVTSVWSVNWGVHALYYKPIQRNINGTWVTISG